MWKNYLCTRYMQGISRSWPTAPSKLLDRVQKQYRENHMESAFIYWPLKYVCFLKNCFPLIEKSKMSEITWWTESSFLKTHYKYWKLNFHLGCRRLHFHLKSLVVKKWFSIWSKHGYGKYWVEFMNLL